MEERKGYNLITEMCSFVLMFWEHVPVFWQGHLSVVQIILTLISLKWLVLSLSKMFPYPIFQDLKQVALIHIGLSAQHHASNCQTEENH